MNTETVEYTETVEERPVHMARCADCDHAVRFRPNSTGTGFFLVGTEELYGVGALGRPVCPNGHGEMELADDRLPIEKAIEQVAEQLTEPQRLPFPSPPFNYEGVLHALCEKRHEIAQLEKRVEGRKEALKNAKDELEEANKELGKMLDQAEKDEQDRLHEIARREAAKAAGHPEETNLVRCAWEQAHPDETCPVCSQGMNGATARDSAMHVDEVERFLFVAETVEIQKLVEDAGIRLLGDTVNGWSVEDRAAVKAWAEIENGIGDTPEGHERPAILGTAHVAQNGHSSEAVPGDTYQCCTECGARLLTVQTGSGETFEPYPAGTLVGVDCPGAGPARYPKRGRKKASA